MDRLSGIEACRFDKMLLSLSSIWLSRIADRLLLSAVRVHVKLSMFTYLSATGRRSLLPATSLLGFLGRLRLRSLQLLRILLLRLRRGTSSGATAAGGDVVKRHIGAGGEWLGAGAHGDTPATGKMEVG